MAVALPLLLADDVGRTIGRTPGLVLFAVIQLSAWMFCRLLIAARPRYMAFCFWIFVYIWFGITAFLQVDHGVFSRRAQYVGTSYSEHMLTTAALIVLIGCIAYLAGGALANTRPLHGGRLRRPRLALSLRKLQIASLVSSALALAAIYAIGITNLFSSREAVTATAPGWTKAARIVIFVAGFLVVYAFRSGRVFVWREITLGTRVVMVTAVAGSLVVGNPIGTQRAISAMVYGALMLAAIPRGSRRGIRFAFVALLLGTVVVFPSLDGFRREQPRIDTTVASEPDTGLRAVLRNPNGNYAMFTQVADGVDYVDRFGHTNGSHLLADGFVFVPRSIWTGKAQDVGDSVADALGYPTRFNFSSPLWMELYVDGGWLLLVAGFVAYGWVSNQLDRASTRLNESAFLPTVVLAVAFYQFYLLRGSLLAAMPLFYVLVVAMALVFRRAPSPAETAPTELPA